MRSLLITASLILSILVATSDAQEDQLQDCWYTTIEMTQGHTDSNLSQIDVPVGIVDSGFTFRVSEKTERAVLIAFDHSRSTWLDIEDGYLLGNCDAVRTNHVTIRVLSHARLWSQPDVVNGSVTTSIPENAEVRITGGIAMGRISYSSPVLGVWYPVSYTTDNQTHNGWVWSERLNLMEPRIFTGYAYTRDNARLWSQPDVNQGSVLQTLERDVQIEIIGGPVSGAIRYDNQSSGWWYQVRLGDTIAWIWSERLSFHPHFTRNSSTTSDTAYHEPVITLFRSSMSIIWIDGVETIDVSWNVDNRPENSNLIFEQILLDGTIRNAELQREIAYVPSYGTGMLSSVFSEGDETLTFQVRLVDLATNQTLVSRQLVLTATSTSDWEPLIVDGEACYQDPFAVSNNIQIGDEVRLQLTGNELLNVYDSPDQNEIVTSLHAGDTVAVEAGPYCIQSQHQNYAMRRWQTNTGTALGWVDEYFYGFPEPYSYYFIPASQADIPTVAVISLTIDPSRVRRDDIATTNFTITWETTHAAALFFEPNFPHENDLPANGSLIVAGRDLLDLIGSNSIQEFALIAYDTQSNRQVISTSLAIE